jgi:hypothetical protein
VLKMSQCSLSELIVPSVVCVADVRGDYISSDISNRTEKFSRAPEVTFAEVIAQPRMLPEQAEGASAFQQLESARDAHGGRQTHEHVHMVRLDLQLENLHPVFLRDFPQKTLAVVADHYELERVLCVLGLCQQACTSKCTHQVECVLPYSMAMSQQSFHFFTRPRANFSHSSR